MEEIFYSACPLNCWDSCGLQITATDGKIIKVDGDPYHPITKGKICSRGRMLEKRMNSSKRLLYPLKKVNDEFKPISWEQALDEIADKLTETKQKYGSAAVLHSHDFANNGILKNLDQRFFNCYGGVTELVGSLCWGAGIEAQRQDFGDAYSHHPGDIANSKNIIIWGRNTARTNMHFHEQLLKVKKQGARIIVIDPIFNSTAKLAEHYISIKPGMDGILAAGVMKEMIRLGLEDRNFIKKHTHGFGDLLELLQTITLEEISKISEVPIAHITLLAEIYSQKPTATYMGLGMQRYHNGGNTIRLIDALAAVSGNIGIAGGGANYANRQVSQSFDIESLTLPHRKKVSRQFPIMKQAEKILNADDPKIEMIIVTCGNPLTQVPDTSIVKKAFTSVPSLVVIDQFMTDTAQLADYVLPAASSFEEEDIYFSSMYHHFVNYGPKIIESPGEAKSDLWIWTELANRLGFGVDFQFSRKEWIEIAFRQLEKEGFTFDKLKESHTLELPVKTIPWEDFVFKTPSGKYEFTFGGKNMRSLSLPIESKWSNSELADHYPYSLLTIHPLRSNHSQNYHLWEREPYVKVEIAINIAKKHDLHDGDMVMIWNDRGEIKGRILISPKIHSNTINIDEGIWSSYGGTVNKLTSSEPSDNELGSTIYDCLVTIKKLS